jgi:hypothetical protein
VVESALLEERRRAVHVRAVLGEDVFWRIAETNPVAFLGDPSQRPTEAGKEEETPEFPRQD